MFSPTQIVDVKAAKIRDINYFQIGDTVLAFACDSSGAVGCMPQDESFRTPEECSFMFPKCVLMELIAAGIEPFAIYNDFCYSCSELLEELCKGIRKHCDSLGLQNARIFNCFAPYPRPGSTAYGVTAVGLVQKNRWKVCCSQAGDLVCALGTPSLKMQLETQVTPAEVKLLRKQQFVHEILPCGSHGFLQEARDLAASNGLCFQEEEGYPLRHEREISCGASAVVLVTLCPQDLFRLQELGLNRQITVIGSLFGKRKGVVPCCCKEATVTVDKTGNIILRDGKRIVSQFVSEYGVGQMKLDKHAVPAHILMKMARTVLPGTADGKEPLLVVNNLNFAMGQGGRQAIRAMANMLSAMGMNYATQFTGSTEDNHVAVQSGYALRVFSLIDSNH